MFADDVCTLIESLPKSLRNLEYGKQVIRSSGSVGANYIEADEGLSKKDYLKHMRIARKEAKESRYWLRLLKSQGNEVLEKKRLALASEADELLRILSAMIQKSH